METLDGHVVRSRIVVAKMVVGDAIPSWRTTGLQRVKLLQILDNV